VSGMSNEEILSEPEGSVQGRAFELLCAAVNQVSQYGPPTAAAIKPIMAMLSFNSFNEQKLGFKNFRAFLDAAAAQGAIEIIRPAPGQDYRLLVPGSTPALQHAENNDAEPPEVNRRNRNEAKVPRSHQRIRNDLWTTFIDWRTSFLRLYDVTTQYASKIPLQPLPFEPEYVAHLRRQWESDPDRFRVIPLVSFDEQVSWMRSFAETVHDSSLRDFLTGALDSERPAGAFRAALRAYNEEQARWTGYMVERVAERINKFANQQGLVIDPYDRSPSSLHAQPSDTPSPTKAFPGEGLAVDVVRAKLHAAIDAMPIHDLLSLQIPVGYLLMS